MRLPSLQSLARPARAAALALLLALPAATSWATKVTFQYQPVPKSGYRTDRDREISRGRR
mgnify:CR=1 FL=1